MRRSVFGSSFQYWTFGMLKLVSIVKLAPLTLIVGAIAPACLAVTKYCGAMGMPVNVPKLPVHCQPLLSSRRGSSVPPGVHVPPVFVRLPGGEVLRTLLE
jgi:hypothetical protein